MEMLPFLIIMLEIIPRLPSKVVTQCKVVCKEWLAILSTPEFARIHCHYMRTSADQKIISVGRRSCTLRSLNYESPNFISGANVRIPFAAHPYNLLFLASLDGMLCVCLKNTCELVVWNPLTGMYKKLSNSNSQGFFKVQSDGLGFCVDSSYDYKIVHIKRRRGTMAIYIYSMRLASWTTTRFLKNRPYHGATYAWSPGTFCGNGLYFIVCQWWLSCDVMIIRFDVNSNEFFEVGFPHVSGEGAMGNLVNIRDELHLIVCYGFYERTVELWKLTNGTWLKMFVYPHLVCIPLSIMSSVTYVNVNGTFVVMTEWGDVIQIDLRANAIGSFCPLPIYQGINGTIYTESIVSPGL